MLLEGRSLNDFATALLLRLRRGAATAGTSASPPPATRRRFMSLRERPGTARRWLGARRLGRLAAGAPRRRSSDRGDPASSPPTAGSRPARPRRTSAAEDLRLDGPLLRRSRALDDDRVACARTRSRAATAPCATTWSCSRCAPKPSRRSLFGSSASRDSGMHAASRPRRRYCLRLLAPAMAARAVPWGSGCMPAEPGAPDQRQLRGGTGRGRSGRSCRRAGRR